MKNCTGHKTIFWYQALLQTSPTYLCLLNKNRKINFLASHQQQMAITSKCLQQPWVMLFHQQSIVRQLPWSPVSHSIDQGDGFAYWTTLLTAGMWNSHPVALATSWASLLKGMLLAARTGKQTHSRLFLLYSNKQEIFSPTLNWHFSSLKIHHFISEPVRIVLLESVKLHIREDIRLLKTVFKSLYGIISKQIPATPKLNSSCRNWKRTVLRLGGYCQQELGEKPLSNLPAAAPHPSHS